MDSIQARQRLAALLGRLLDPDELHQAQALSQLLGVHLHLTWWRTDLRSGRTWCLTDYGAAADRSTPTPPALKTPATGGSTTIPTR